MMKHLPTILLLVLGLVIGIGAVVYGEADDSPGLQGLGAILSLAILFFGTRFLLRKFHRQPPA